MAKQKNKLKGKLQLHVSKHLLWDQISAKVDKFREYLNYMKDKRALEDSTLTKFKVVDEILQQRLANKSQSTIKLLKKDSNETLRILGVKDRCDIIIQAKKFIEKHYMKANVKDKAQKMQK